MNRLALVVALSLSSSALAEEPRYAQVPLDEILALHDRIATLERGPSSSRHIVLDRAVGTVHVVRDAAEVGLRFEVVVGPGGHTPARLPLLEVAPDVDITALPREDGLALVSRDGWLTLEATKTGRAAFDVAVLVRGRRMALAIAPAALARLEVVYDADSIAVESESLHAQGGRPWLFAKRDRFELAWRPLRPPVETPRPESNLDPIVTRAFATTLLTLEGRRLTRVHYALRVPRRTKIGLVLGAEQHARAVAVNGANVAYEEVDGRVVVEAEPSQPGGDTGEVTLVLADDTQPFALAGSFGVRVPRATWPTREVYLAIHLPPAFTFTPSGGTMVPAETPVEVPPTDLPTSGVAPEIFHAFLVGDAGADVRLDYLVALDGQYYRGSWAR